MNQEHAYKRHLTKDEIAQASYYWTEPIKSGPVHTATADYLGLDCSTWVATTIDDKGWREDYITDKVLYELVEQLTEDLRAAKSDDERDMLLDKHLDILDAWGKAKTKQCHQH